MPDRTRPRPAAAHGQAVRRRPGFSIVELLVVIAIIAVLASVLLVALNGAQRSAKNTKTIATMNAFEQSAEAFQIDFGAYPGILPDRVLATAPAPSQLTMTENALLHMMGGARVLSPADEGTDNAIEREYDAYPGTELTFSGASDGTWRIKIAINISAGAEDPRGRMGEGPFIEGKPQVPYFAPSTDAELVATRGQEGEDPALRIPDLIDAWGTPVMYIRRLRTTGPIVGDRAVLLNPAGVKPQFTSVGMLGYTTSIALGSLGTNQLDGRNGSVLNLGTDEEQLETLRLALEHPALENQARGGFLMWSAGSDGVYLSRTDGAGSDDAPIAGTDAGFTLTEFHDFGPAIVDEFDDLRLFGGG